VADTDDLTGDKLVQRPDDTEAKAKTRIELFHQETKPVISYYAQGGLMHRINANDSMPNIYNEVKSVVDNIDTFPTDIK